MCTEHSTAIKNQNNLNGTNGKHNQKKTFILLIMLAVCTVQILLIFFGGTMFRTHALPFTVIRDTILLAFTVIPFDLMRKIFDRIFFMGF